MSNIFFNTWYWWLKEMKESFIQVLHLSPNIMNTLHIPLFLFLGGNNHSQVPSDKEHKLNTHFCSSVDQTYVGIGFIYLHCQVQLNKVSQRSVCGSCVLSQEWKRGTEDDTDCIHSPNAYIEGWRWEYGCVQLMRWCYHLCLLAEQKALLVHCAVELWGIILNSCH